MSGEKKVGTFVSDAPVKSKDEVTDEDRTQAEAHKTKGNTFFKEHHFEEALKLYSKAIESDPYNKVYYTNRSFCELMLEHYAKAVSDASMAIELDPSYVRAYARRGAAYFLMGKPKEALPDFRKFKKAYPKSGEAKKRYNACRKAVTEIEFAEAIKCKMSRPASECMDWRETQLPSEYKGPVWKDDEPLTHDTLVALIEWMRDENKAPERYILRIILEVIPIFRDLNSMVRIPVPKDTKFTVCGDVHGQFYDVLHVFERNGWPSKENPYLFNGDFVDRGSWGLEIMIMFFGFKVLYPNHFHMLRGNHESDSMNGIFGFKGEVLHKMNSQAYALFTESFNWLPLCAVLGEKVFICHGGLFSQDGVKLEDLEKIKRVRQPGDKDLMSELLWADPQKQEGRGPSKRGCGLSFGPDVTKAFLKDNGLDLLVRSHEVKEEGYEVEADGHLITIFSAPNYCDSNGNKGAWITFKDDMKPVMTQFTAVKHPNIPPMAYSSAGRMM